MSKQGEIQASWEELVALNLEEKAKCCWESQDGDSILNPSAAIDLKAEAAQHLWKPFWILVLTLSTVSDCFPMTAFAKQLGSGFSKFQHSQKRTQVGM